jgi:hypothetical protein
LNKKEDVENRQPSTIKDGSPNDINITPLMKDVTEPTKLNSKKNPIKTSIPQLNAEKINKFVNIEAQILGEVKHKAIPGKVHIFCKNCDESLDLDIRDSQELMGELLFSKKNTRTILAPLLGGKCPNTKDGEGSHYVDFETEDHADYSLLQVRDVIRHDEKYNIQDYKPKWIHLVNHDIPDAKKISLNGIVVYDDTPQKRNIEVISDSVKPLEDELAQFKITDSDKIKFDRHFKKIPLNQMAPGMVGRDSVRETMLLLLHSPPYIPDIHPKGSLQRGLLRIIFLGDSKTNKSTAAKDLTPLNIGGKYPFGEFVSAETGSRTGILYTIDTDKKALSWGSLVLNDMGLVILDGMHSLHSEEVKGMREVLEQLMVVVRRSVSGDALARTRIIGIINPNHPMNQYLHACQAIKDTWVFKDPVDITRWDLFLPFRNEDVEFDDIINAEPQDRPIPDDIFIRHVYWAWSRKPEEIIYPKNIKQLIIEAYKKISNFQTSEIPLVHPAIKYVILRLSVAYATLLHSTNDTHDLVIVKEDHVKMASDILKTTYGLWELAEYIEEREGNNIDKGFLEILGELDTLAINILLKLQEKARSIRALASDFDVNKKKVESRYSVLKDLNMIDTSRRPAAITPFGIKFLKQILEIHRRSRSTLSPHPQNGDKQSNVYEDDPTMTPEKGLGDNTQNFLDPSREENSLEKKTNEELYNVSQYETGPEREKAEEILNNRLLKETKFNHTENFIKEDIIQIVEARPGEKYFTEIVSDVIRRGGSETDQDIVTSVAHKMLQTGLIKQDDEGLILPGGEL